MEINRLFSNLIYEDGIWIPKVNLASISYPADGNAACSQIEDDSFWFKHRNNCILEVLKKYHNKSDIFLDIGGGNGFVAKFLQDNGIKVCLLEPGSTGVLNARQKGLDNVIQSTLEDITPNPNFKVSSIGLFDVVEHIEDDSSFLQKVNQYLPVSGRIFITVPAFNTLWSKNDEKAGHFRRHTTKTLNKLLLDSGFKIDYVTYFFSALFLPLLIMRSIPSRLGLHNENNVREKTIKHHRQATGLKSTLSNKVWRYELKKISDGRRIKFGTSCLVVASKIDNK